MPEGYPITLMSQRVFKVIVEGKGYEAGSINKNFYSGNWGYPTMDGKGRSLPDSLKLYWYSYVENKYYQLETKLDRTKILDYFKKGYKYDRIGHLDSISQVDYDDLAIGIARGGDVALWILSSNDSKEIGFLKLEKPVLKGLKNCLIPEMDLMILYQPRKEIKC
ncbi:hypothetical protein HNQ02_003289 [Flavobacterium sp. 7E]|uniref:DUF2931 family protein n=1 Tax=Flavobacterium sp. 7E TaxID=2735898 RepID=UPI001570FE5B|nr:DUF2931 family protein [Flavobacterium sp. 7E]NRS90349.1 hypothetical protein [Flavobacterium sp. 7E]